MWEGVECEGGEEVVREGGKKANVHTLNAKRDKLMRNVVTKATLVKLW